MPTGPWIVLMISLIALISFLIAPQKGLIAKWIRQYKNQKQFIDENVLKVFYNLGEDKHQFFEARKIQDLLQKRSFDQKSLLKSLQRLQYQGYVRKQNAHWHLTTEGLERGKRVTKLHRLWEVYLAEYLKIAPHHVHNDAEAMEHIITPELEKLLEERLQYPKIDPHQAKIPYE
jgi:manganese/zinc/iron transport system permease protein